MIYFREDDSNTNRVAASNPMLRKDGLEPTYKQGTIFYIAVS